MDDELEDDDEWGIDAWDRKCESNAWRLETNPLYKQLHDHLRSIKTLDDTLAVEWMKYRNACRVMDWLHHKEWNMELPVPNLAQGVSDEDLLHIIGESFGIYGGCSLEEHYWFEEHGGKNPKCAIRDSKTHPDWRTVKLLKGSELVSEVRSLIGIPQPVPEGQIVMF